MSVQVDKVIIDRETVLVHKRSVPGGDDAFDVCVTSIYGNTYRYAGEDGSASLTEQQASKLVDRVKEARAINPERWSIVQEPVMIHVALHELRCTREYARLAQILLLKLLSEKTLSHQATSLLVHYLQDGSEEIIRDLRQAGYLDVYWYSPESREAIADMKEVLFDLWKEEVERAKLAGTNPESIRHAGYRIGMEHPTEIIQSEEGSLEIEVSEDREEDRLTLIWIDHEYDGEVQ